MRPDFIAEMTLYETEAGGRRGPLIGETHRFPLFPNVNEHVGYEAVMLLHGLTPWRPGETRRVPIVVLNKEAILPDFHEGRRFWFWEGGFKGEGVVREMHWRRSPIAAE